MLNNVKSVFLDGETYGVLLGSVFGLLLFFLLHINDLTDAINLYADDTVMIRAEKSAERPEKSSI